MLQPGDFWNQLGEPWHAAFEEAWASWRQGSLAVGAVITDGGQIVARGQNQLHHRGPGVISQTWMAHAEMNALAQLPLGRGHSYTLYSTLQPCQMCTGAIQMYRITDIRSAASDPVWADAEQWFRNSPWPSFNERHAVYLEGVIGAFAYVLHVSRLHRIAAPHVMAYHADSDIRRLTMATSEATLLELTEVAEDDASRAVDALTALWTSLQSVAVRGLGERPRPER